MATITSQKGKRGITYRVQVRKKGQYAAATFRRLTDAKDWATQIERDILDGAFSTTLEAQKHTLGELIDRYIAEQVYGVKDGEKIALKKSSRDWDRCLTWWKGQIGDVKLSAVTPPLLIEYRDNLRAGSDNGGKGRSNATVNRYLAYLSHPFTIAVREWQWLAENPLRRISKLKEPRGRVRFLSDDERKMLLETCKVRDESLLYPFVVLAISTGARQGELLQLRWPDVDLNKGVAVVHDTKNFERRALPLSGLALELLKKRTKVRRIDTDLVFANDQGKATYPRADFEQAVSAAKIKDFRFHDLRHTAASYLAMSGATLAEIAEILGHKTLSMVKRYAHLTEQHTHSVVARMNEAYLGGGLK